MLCVEYMVEENKNVDDIQPENEISKEMTVLRLFTFENKIIYAYGK